MGTTSQKIQYLGETKSLIKDSINLTGANIGSNDTFRSYAVKLRDGLVNVLNNGTIVLYNNFPKVSGTGSNISLSNTLEAPMFMNKLDGDTKQLILPSGYTQVDYIESSGTQYIDTGYQITSTTNIEVKTNSGASAGEVFGVEVNSIGYISTVGYWRIFSTSGYRNTNYLDTYEFKTDGSKVYLKDGTLVVDCEATPVNIPNYNLYLFARNRSGTINYGRNARIYYFRIYNNNVLVRDFIPCYRNSDNEIGMYDIVNNVFYTNQGTGSFTYGSIAPTPDSPIDIQCVEGIQNITIDDGNGNSQTYEVNLGNIKLYNGDYITGTPDNWSIVRENGEFVFDGSETWLKNGYSFVIVLSIGKPISLCSHFTDSSTSWGSSNEAYRGKYTTTNQDDRFKCMPLIDMTIEEFKTWLSNNNVTLVYKLATPTTTSITDTYLISQLNALYNAKSYNGQTNISVSGQLPMILEVSALKDEI